MPKVLAVTDNVQSVSLASFMLRYKGIAKRS